MDKVGLGWFRLVSQRKGVSAIEEEIDLRLQ